MFTANNNETAVVLLHQINKQKRNLFNIYSKKVIRGKKEGNAVVSVRLNVYTISKNNKCCFFFFKLYILYHFATVFKTHQLGEKIFGISEATTSAYIFRHHKVYSIPFTTLTIKIDISPCICAALRTS